MLSVLFTRRRSSLLVIVLIGLLTASPGFAEMGSWFSWDRLFPRFQSNGKAKTEKPVPPPPAPAVPAEEELDEYAVPQFADPLEGFNRAIFRFNDGAYTYVLRPVARGYTKVVPKPVRRGLTNFFDNIRYPIRFTSSVLQGKGKRAAQETGRFALNSTIGLGGLMRVSDDVPALAHVPNEDIGQTFGVWHIGHGPYIVVPILGPTSSRDLVGRFGDMALSPLNWRWLDHYDWTVRAGLQATDTVNGLPSTMDMFDQFKTSAIDPYVAMRNGYLVYRNEAVKR